jgi:hypothetical protein
MKYGPITFNYAPCSTAGRGKDGDLGAMGVEVPSRDPTNTYSWAQAGWNGLITVKSCLLLSFGFWWLAKLSLACLIFSVPPPCSTAGGEAKK